MLDFVSAKFVMGYPCVRTYILLYIHGSAHSDLRDYISDNTLISSYARMVIDQIYQPFPREFQVNSRITT